MAIFQTDGENLQQQSSLEIPEGNANTSSTTFSNESADQSTGNQNYTGIATPTIVNQTVPVVVFVGPPSSGKSMILVRLAKYLHNHGYTVDTDPTFLNTPEYQQHCLDFKASLTSDIALPGTVKYLLVKVYDRNGVEIAKLLEAPGEDFYTTDPEMIRMGKNQMIEPYLQTIMTSRNKKSYVMILDLDSKISFRRDGNHRASYERRILDYFYNNTDKNRDRVILLYNKIDMTHFGDIHGCSNPSGALQDAKLYYPALFASMKVRRLGFFEVDNFSFKPFCTGMFADQKDNFGNPYQTYNIASDEYPRDLWKEIISKW